MSRLTKDPLLAFAQILIVAFMSMAVVVALGMLIGIPFAIINREEIFGELLLQSNHSTTEVMAIIVAAFVLMIVMMGLWFKFLQNLLWIINSVGKGDPFVPVNADRLRNMGWTMVALHLVAIPVVSIAGWVTSFTDHAGPNLDGPGSGIVLIVVLFVLSRVFKKGSEMREDLEGTV